MHVNDVKKVDTFRGGTKHSYDPSPVILSESNYKTMETIKLGAQAASNFRAMFQSYFGNQVREAEISQVSESKLRSNKTRLSKPILHMG